MKIKLDNIFWIEALVVSVALTLLSVFLHNITITIMLLIVFAAVLYINVVVYNNGCFDHDTQREMLSDLMDDMFKGGSRRDDE